MDLRIFGVEIAQSGPRLLHPRQHLCDETSFRSDQPEKNDEVSFVIRA
jgi:hypothetical protein